VADLAYHGAYTTFVVTSGSTFDKRGYNRDIAALETLPVWTASDHSRTLWDHQKQAIAFCAAYCRLGPLGASPEAGLIKMPTGTGKSGVVAVVSRCLSGIRKVLVLTPREGLVQQMLADIQRRFWHNMAVAPAEGRIWDGPGVEPATIQLLLPNAGRTRHICQQAGTADRLILVGTLQALDKIRSTRDRLARKAVTGLDDREQDDLTRLDEILSLLTTFDLILVDEGHYEPAPSWSRSVRGLARPTLLLSATPFRNDYKLFSVRGAYAYNLPFQRAAEANIVREIAFTELGAAGGSAPAIDAGERDGDQPLTAQDSAAIDAFATNLLAAAQPLLAGKPPGSKIIVRGGSWSALAALQVLLAGATGHDAVLIHEQARDATKRSAHPGRYPTVKMAQAGSPGSIFWLHQTKLLEGIDDASFVGVALLDDFTNDRQLVQQIGRVLRSTDPTRAEKQTATVFARNPENLARLEASWAQFLSFEAAGEGHIDRIIPGEAYLPEKIIPHMPERQYVDGRFRERLPVNLVLNREDVVVPRRAALFDIGAGFDEAILRAEAYEGILARNRFVIQSIANCPVNVWGWSFFTVDESPYLARHFVTEWRFGLTLIVRAADRLFVFDTDGVPFDLKKVGVTRLDRSHLVRLFAPSTVSQKVRITKLAASSLDMSDRAIRTMTTSTASFEDTFTDLLDAVLLPTNVAGYVGQIPRYLGLTRSKLSEATVRRVTVDDYVAWVTAIDAELTSASAANRVFDRFAQLTTPDLDMAAEPRNILLDLQPLDDFGAFVADQEGNVPPALAPVLADVCADITAGVFQVTQLDGTALDCTITFDKKSGRYAIASESLNASVESKLSRAGTVMTLTERINSDQAFRILTDETDKVYMHGKWVKARDLVVDGRVPALDGAEIVPALKNTFIEKGEEAWAAGNMAKWQTTSIFGLTKRYLDAVAPGTDGYAAALHEFPLVLLDDDGQEMADFILVSEDKVALLHAKAIGSDKGGNGAGVTDIQEVGRQVAASLGFFLTSSPQIADDRWLRPYVANTTSVPPFGAEPVRVFRNRDNIAANAIAAKVRAALRDRRINKEVWLVAGRLIDIEVARTRALKGDLSNRTRQLLMYIDSLTTACGRANARLRIFAH
jgi:superfamily II DNA or RNA helicase